MEIRKDLLLKTHSIFYLPKQKKWLFLYSPYKINVYYKNKKHDLISNKIEDISTDDIYKEFLKYRLNVENHLNVWHLTYELGHIFHKQDDLIKKNDVLGIEICFSKKKILSNLNFVNDEKIELKNKNNISYKEYSKDFNLGYKNLLKGNCYQFNLTFNFEYEFIKSFSVLGILKKIFQNNQITPSFFAHGTYIKELNRGIVSNSPECLFSLDLKDFELVSMPIKGSASISDHQGIKNAFRFLTSGEKDQAELNMITDLIRNDLSKIGPSYSKVVFKRAPLIVPGIVHQYSKIKVKIQEDATLLDILKGIFPGGSITGAPKKRVIEILKIIEKRTRGFYTGSTLLLTPQKWQSSINIRTLTIDFNKKKCFYGAGGGITLLSNCYNEYLEMKLKLKSFFKLLK